IDDAKDEIQETVNWCREYGFVNDAGYALMKVKSGRAKGYSAKQIKQKLAQAGISSQQVLEAFSKVGDTSDTEFQAALTMARKKRIGPYARTPIIDHEERTRQMARLARAGYSYEICKNVFDYLGES
ncbi:MAG: regulatory protein RecX, partial [Alphaproteobacteria bacterium]